MAIPITFQILPLSVCLTHRYLTTAVRSFGLDTKGPLLGSNQSIGVPFGVRQVMPPMPCQNRQLHRVTSWLQFIA